MKKLYERPLDALGDRFPEMIVTIVTIGWGLMLMLPSDTFSTSQGYTILSNIAPEQAWGASFFVAGLGTLHGIIVQNKLWVRRAGKVLFFMWMLLSIAFIVAAPAAASWVLLVGLSLLFGWMAVSYS